jgi:phosphoribosylaminoimidazole-succinocarboxamide synthase
MELLRKGKVKDVYEVDEDTLEFRFSDRVSVFDKIIPTDIPEKGEVLCREAAYWFQEVEDEGIVDTHFRGLAGPRRMQVDRVDVIDDYDAITRETTNYLVPLEVVCRHHAAGSFIDRIEKGKLDPTEAGLPAGEVPEYGQELPEPFVEFTTKLESTDRPLTDEEAKDIAGLTDDELETLKETTLAIDALIEEQVEPRGLVHVDGKKEFAYDADRNLTVVDSFGTHDEDRWWDKDAYENGEILERSKEFVRQYYRETGYHERLYDARDAGEKEPDIPPLPDEMIERVTELYVDGYERMTGDGF